MKISLAVKDFLAQIFKERRLILMRRHWFWETEEDIAKRCRTTPARVKAQLFFARRSYGKRYVTTAVMM